MSYPVFISVVQGETLSFEVRLVGEDITDATPYVKCSIGMPEVNFTLTKELPDTIKVVAEGTTEFSLGNHDLEIWLQWPSGDILTEIVKSVIIGVEPSSDGWAQGIGVIDGGFASTIHLFGIDGGGG